MLIADGFCPGAFVSCGHKIFKRRRRDGEKGKIDNHGCVRRLGTRQKSSVRPLDGHLQILLHVRFTTPVRRTEEQIPKGETDATRAV